MLLRILLIATVLAVYVFAMIRLRKIFYRLEDGTEEEDSKINTEGGRDKK